MIKDLYQTKSSNPFKDVVNKEKVKVYNWWWYISKRITKIDLYMFQKNRLRLEEQDSISFHFVFVAFFI
jgi:hypothetical protein